MSLCQLKFHLWFFNSWTTKLIFHSPFYVRKKRSQRCWSSQWLTVLKRGSRGPACSVGLNLQCMYHSCWWTNRPQLELPHHPFSVWIRQDSCNPCWILLLQACILPRRCTMEQLMTSQWYPQLLSFCLLCGVLEYATALRISWHEAQPKHVKSKSL